PYSVEAAERRDISESISGNGILQPANAYTITTLVKGDIVSADFEVGDQVEKGEILYRIDDDETATGVQQEELTLSESKMNYQIKLEDLQDLQVKAPVKGTVRDIAVKVGDEVKAGDLVAVVQDSTRMKLKLPFPAADAAAFTVGQSADVILFGSFETLPGFVSEVSGAESVLEGNVLVKYVTIEVENPGALSESQLATAEIGGSGASQQGNFTYVESRKVLADLGGKVVSIAVKEGDQVERNTLLLTLESKELNNTVQSAANRVKSAELSLQAKRKQLEGYTVKSPISGTVIEKKYKVGDMISDAGKELCTIYDLSHMHVTLNVDELDISKIKAGQKAQIRSNAVPDAVYEGVVSNITMKGKTENGVTTYPVEIQVNDVEGLMAGMNVRVEIEIQAAENAVSIPAAALEAGNLVLVEGGEMDPGNPAVPAGYGYREVEVGVSDGAYVEILSGVSDGENVAYDPMMGSFLDMDFGF
ncbi:MAG: HlyD family efflux transporter periplasmic adaptor subunit, partial [Bacillota bacterium]|nr:HlyD family efflux transporter periplasmic adaptor subunit [Bacillota bacterium]